MIRRQFPKQEWRPNPVGQTRTIEEAIAIARRFGVQIPDDVDFFVDEFGYLDATTTARSSRLSPRTPETPVQWSDFVASATGKVPFLIRPDVLEIDEAIVAVIAHEMYELEELRPLLLEGKTSIKDIIWHSRPGVPGNLHDKAWDVADTFVERMKGEEK